MKRLLLLIIAFKYYGIFAQSAYKVSDETPVTVNGLTLGYTIKSEEEKEVGNKGNFSRFSVKFYVSNPTQESKIMLYKDGLNLLGNVSDQLAQFNCLNATGARFTSKSATIQAAPCNVLALVEDKDANGKIIKNKRFVQIGYWIKAGQTISTSAIVIVPLNQRPAMEVLYLANALQPMASAGYSENVHNYGNAYSNTGNGGYVANQQSTAPQSTFGTNYVKIKNASSGHYLNTESGPLSCSTINNEWWSAQWQIIPVTMNGATYYSIQNRWKSSFISIDNGTLLSESNQVTSSMWVLETMDGGSTYTIKNAARNAAITDQRGIVQAITLDARQPNAHWIIEQ